MAYMTQILDNKQGSGTAPVRVPRVHPAWKVAAVAGLVVMLVGITTGIPDLITDPVQSGFGWSHGTIGLAFAVNIALYGLTAPFSAALMDRFGIRRVVVVALLTMAAGAALTMVMTSPLELVAGWGLLVGLGTGSVALTFTATVANRWFVARRGLVSGVLASASMFGGMVLMPALAWLMSRYQWRAPIMVVGLAALLLIPVGLLFLRDHPADLNMGAYGTRTVTPKPVMRDAGSRALRVLWRAMKTGPFWLLVGTFGVCGASTNGIMMTYFVPAAHDRGMAMTVASSLLALMGIFNVVGAGGSGWLTDRFDPRWLLAVYYGLRGISLAFLPWLMTSTVHPTMLIFAVAYGLLDLATVPPTITLCQEIYGDDDGPVVFGWVNAAHQLGAGGAAFLGGVARGAFGTYTPVWLVSAALCLLAVVLAMLIKRGPVKHAPSAVPVLPAVS